MIDIVCKLLPILLIFALGFALKFLKLLKQTDADVMLKLVFFISLPALILLSVSSIRFTTKFTLLPLISFTVILLTYFFSSIYIKKTNINQQQQGVFRVATMIMNVGFLLPFIISSYGAEGLARITIFDIANGIITYTFTYFIALKHSKEQAHRNTLINKLLLSIPIWAFLIAFAMNILELSFYGVAERFLNNIGQLTTPLIMLALGASFTPTIILPKQLFVALIIRVVFGFAVGYAFCSLIEFDPITRKIVLLGTSAPVGYNTLVFSSIAKLDNKFAASLISYSILLGIILAMLIIILPI